MRTDRKLIVAAVAFFVLLLGFNVFLRAGLGLPEETTVTETTVATTTESTTVTIFPEVTTSDGTGAYAQFSTTTGSETGFFEQFQTTTTESSETTAPPVKKYSFRTDKLYTDHYNKHGSEFGDITKEEYLRLANELINYSGSDILTKTQDDGDRLFYREKTNEFLIISGDGYIRTYFKPVDKKDYFDRQ